MDGPTDRRINREDASGEVSKTKILISLVFKESIITNDRPTDGPTDRRTKTPLKIVSLLSEARGKRLLREEEAGILLRV